jgi:hypothetical protein
MTLSDYTLALWFDMRRRAISDLWRNKKESGNE